MPVETAHPPPAASLKSPADGTADFTRLHITPLDADLIRFVVPASVLPRARNISYHSIETFPEKRYGFVDLPQAEAEKITKRLNGSVLRGAKMKVEKARPDVQPEVTGDAGLPEKKKKKSKDADGSKKRKRENGVVEGVVLKERKVKRGWTEAPDTQKRRKSKKDKDSKDKDKEKRKRTKSKYTEGEECLVKTVVPPNAMKNLAPEDVPRKKKKGKSREVTVHEFEKTTKFPSFLKDSAASTNGPSATEFVEGKGWVDAEGNVVEPAKHKSRPASKPAKESKQKKTPVVEEDSDDTSSSGTSSDEEDDSSSDAESEVEVPTAKNASDEQDEEDSSEEESSESPERKTPTSALKEDSSRPTSSSSSRNLTIKIPPPATPAAKVHPLEALYKRQKPDAEATAQTPSQEAQPFSFFAADEQNDDEEPSGEPAVAMPMTPFTRQDLEWRNIRSAAPTPDTAHPSRIQNFWPSQEEEDEEMEDEAEADGEENGEQAQPGSSDFQSWFWENRRDLNRSWMGRRKAAAKEKRHRENKARASKVV